jgi:hypothetical protein
MSIPEVGPCPSRASVLCNVSCVVLPPGSLTCVIVYAVSSVLAWMGSSESSA